MAHPALPFDGGCRCDRVRFRITAPPLLAMLCHCTGCQRMTGSAFSTSLAIPSDGFAVMQGDTVIGGLHGDQSRHHHCDWCKSWLFTRLPSELGFVNVRATMLDDASWYVPLVETCTDDALPWAGGVARHGYPGFPPMDAFPALLAEYAAG